MYSPQFREEAGKQFSQDLGSSRVHNPNGDSNSSMKGNFARVKLPPTTLPNGGVYTGEWKGPLRDGFGQQLWPDGSRYEGYYHLDKACGYGKLYHADGDLYEGEWLNDMAHGRGKYSHSNGAEYEG
jgi:hypothetical protein